jgi:hypothetical protein
VQEGEGGVYRQVVEVERMTCRGLSIYKSWIQVPKLPEGNTVIFEGSLRRGLVEGMDEESPTGRKEKYNEECGATAF